MNQSTNLEILCLRHGKTNYTGKPRDLTPEGEAHVRQVAEDSVLPWVRRHSVNLRDLSIYSSPAPRAHFTATCVAEVILHEGSLLPRVEMGPTTQRDAARAALVYADLRAGKRHVSYETEPAFQDPTIFETPAEVRARWYAFFANYVKQAYVHGPRHSILVSHYEVLCNLVHDLFGIVATEATELLHAEPIFLSVSDYGWCGIVTVTGQFRGQEARAVFNPVTLVLTRCL